MGIADKIAEIELEISRTQKNKATEHHLGTLKAKLAKYKADLEGPTDKTSKGPAFEVKKSGDARVALIGFPSVGKSTLLSTITSTFSKQAETEFTTLDCISGKLEYQGASIQILDLPGIIDGASLNRGRGRQIISIARTADLILMLLDHRRSEDKKILINELSNMGIRLNKRKPEISLFKYGSGQDISVTCKLTKINESTIKAILKEYKIHHCQLTIREDISDEDLVDFLSSQAVYVKCLFVYNKIDELSYADFLKLANDSENVVISCNKKWNLDGLKEKVWEGLDIIRVYTKKRGEDPDFEKPVIVKKGSNISRLCSEIHKDFELTFKHAFVWGKSTKHSPQKVGLLHALCDEDIVQISSK